MKVARYAGALFQDGFAPRARGAHGLGVQPTAICEPGDQRSCDYGHHHANQKQALTLDPGSRQCIFRVQEIKPGVAQCRAELCLARGELFGAGRALHESRKPRRLVERGIAVSEPRHVRQG